MRPIETVLELLNTLILFGTNDTVQIYKKTLSKIQICLQNAQDKIEFLQLESQFQQEELQQWSHHSEPVSVQKIERDSHQ